jgi:NAD-dependent deacetylase
MSRSVDAVLSTAARRPGRIVVLTGAGISAESGIPTFRGADGYWTVGSRHYRPEEMATRAFFGRHPEVSWGWYLQRAALCAAAQPNAAHRALVELQRGLGERCVLVTQNVDGLHLAAGSAPERTWQVHGNLHRMRCAAGCRGLLPLPAELGRRGSGRPLEPHEAAGLRCGRCGAWVRPHVLWFDECYDEENYRFESAIQATWDAALLFVVGTTGGTGLPTRMAQIAVSRAVPLVDVDPAGNVFAELAAMHACGAAVQGAAAACVPALVRRLLELCAAPELRPPEPSP